MCHTVLWSCGPQIFILFHLEIKLFENDSLTWQHDNARVITSAVVADKNHLHLQIVRGTGACTGLVSTTLHFALPSKECPVHPMALCPYCRCVKQGSNEASCPSSCYGSSTSGNRTHTACCMVICCNHTLPLFRGLHNPKLRTW